MRYGGWIAAAAFAALAYVQAVQYRALELKTAKYAAALASCANRGDFLIGDTIVHCTDRTLVVVY